MFRIACLNNRLFRFRWLTTALLFGLVSPHVAFAWRSALYPDNWQPGFADGQGHFLHDFSYAGYHHSEGAIPSNPLAHAFNAVTAYGADNTGATDATAALQAAIDDAVTSGGGIVFVPAGLYRCDGKVTVNGSHIVMRGEGPANTRIYFTSPTGVDYDANIKFEGNVQWGGDLPLAVDGVNESLKVYLADASSLAVGQEIGVGWVITDAFVAAHGMTGTWTAFNGQWRPFFRRRVVALNLSASPNEVTLDVPLRYPALLRDSASIRPVVHSLSVQGYLVECGIENLALSNAIDPGEANLHSQIHVIYYRNVEDSWVRNVQSFASPLPAANGFHVQSGGIGVENSNRITVENCRMEQAENLGDGGNGYLFEISRSNEVLTRDCEGLTGRHNFIQNWDFGTTGCVWLRCHTEGGFLSSEYHHSLSMACLVDSCFIGDSWSAINRGLESTGAGHSATECGFWNSTGLGILRSWQYGVGYVIGTSPDIFVWTAIGGAGSEGTAPADYVEGAGLAGTQEPQSLFEDQLARRLAALPTLSVPMRKWRGY